MKTNKQPKTKIKICGITNLPDARYVSGAQVDYMGFIFYEESPRFIDPAKAGAIINWIEGPKCVGVFVNQPLDDVNMIARQTGIDLVQLHGEESPEYCDLVEKPIIKALHITNKTTVESLQKQITSYQSHVDYLLFDNKTKEKWGGTGDVFDWNILPRLNTDFPYFLSGGLKPGNINIASETVQSYAVDVASGVEEYPGKKSFDKIEAFMQQMNAL